MRHQIRLSAEFAFAVVMGVMILLFCIFLVWMTKRPSMQTFVDLTGFGGAWYNSCIVL